MAEEEPDYLSEEFIVNAESDIRPGLLFNSGQKRQHELSKKIAESNKRSRTKPIRVLEEEKRDQALDAALNSSNKGFALLQKMGYKPGMTIGKQGLPENSASREPIRPVVKNNRFGLGQETRMKEQAKERVDRLMEQHKKRVQGAQQLSVDYQARLRAKRKCRRVLSDLRRSQNVCFQLDSQAGLEFACETWFWPADQNHDQDEDQDDTSLDEENEEDIFQQKHDQLKEITSYLKDRHHYCLWCGTSYNDAADLQANCPGPTAEDHD